MIVITNGTEYIYLDEEHQIQKTTDISKAKTFTFKGCSIFIRENVKQPRAFMPMTRKHSVSVTDERRKSVSQRPQE